MVMQKKWCMYRAVSPVFRGVSLFDYPNDILTKRGKFEGIKLCHGGENCFQHLALSAINY